MQESGSVEECGAAAKTFYLCRCRCRCRCAFRCGCGSLLMLLPFVKCCLLLQLSMLRSTLQVLLLLPLLLLLLFTQVALPAASCLLPVAIGYVLQSCRSESRGAYIRLSSRTRLLCSALLCSVLEFALGFFDLLRALAFAFSCAMR